MNFEPGTIIDGKYRIVRLLGSGGMGAVYEGENVRIKRRVAIKVLHANVSSQAEAVQRFEREAQAAGRIGSEHICEVLDLGVMPDGTRFLVMEYLEGENLSARITRLGRLTPAQSIPLLVQLLDGLTAAHSAGIIHRDLKPDNVWVLPQLGGTKDFVKILDFGVSKFSQLGGEDAMHVTRAGAVVGTPYYMSPEQARGMSAIDQRSDIYAIGVLLYQVTTGQVPFQAETFNELLFKIVLEPPSPPTQYVPDLDPEFGVIIARAMAREPTQRFQSCQEFREALLGYQRARGLGTTSSPPGKGVHGTMMLDGGLGASGMGQSGAGAQAFSQSGAQGRVPSGVGWSPSQSGSHPGAAVAHAAGPGMTAQSWGNASGADAPKVPKSKAGLWIAVIGGAALVGVLGVVAVVFLGGRGGANAAHPTSTSVEATPPPASTGAPTATSAATAAAPTATSEASASPSATATAQATTVAASDPKTPAKTPAGAKAPTKPASTGAPTSKPATKTPGGSDFGY